MSLQDAIMSGDNKAVEELLKGHVLEDDLNKGINTSEKRSTQNNVFNMMDTSSKPPEVYEQITDTLKKYKQRYEQVNALNKTTEGQKLPLEIVGEIAKMLGVKKKNPTEWANKGGKKTKKRLMKQRKSKKTKSKKSKRTNKRKPRN
jgi:hypothetical protein